MTLILLALSLSIALCIIAYNLAIYALPIMVGLSAAQFVYGAGAGVAMSGLAAISAALISIGLVIAVLGFAKNPILGLIALAVVAVPAAIAGYPKFTLGNCSQRQGFDPWTSSWHDC